MGKRIEYLDFLKAFAIISVLIGHSTEQLSADLFWDHPSWEFIYSYHMPLFIFISGLFFSKSLEKPYGKMVLDKFVRLGIPSILAFGAQCIIMAALGVTAIADLCELSFNGFMNCVWFLKCLFFCCLIMYPVCRLFRNVTLSAAVASIAVILIPGAGIVNLNFMLPVFCLGMAVGKNIGEIGKYRKIWLGASALIFIVLLCFWSGRLTIYMVPTATFNPETGAFDLHNLGITLYRLALGMSGSMLFFLLAEPAYRRLSRFKFCGTLCNIGTCTLGIYVLQTFLLEILINILDIYIPLPWSYLAAPLLAAAELAICYNLVRVYNLIKGKITK